MLDLGRLRLHGVAVLASLVLLGGLLLPWINFVQLVFKYRILTGVFFVLALLVLELSGYFLLRAVRERPVTLGEALIPLFYSASGVLSFIFGYFFIVPINPVATIYLIGAAGLAGGSLFFWPQSPQIRALLTGRSLRYSAVSAGVLTLLAGAWLVSSGWAQRPISINPPIAEFVVLSQTIQVGEPIDFDASASRARQGKVVSYEWDFGDGTWYAARDGTHVTHVYVEPGQYEVTLRVTDERGEVSPAYRLFITVQGESGFETMTTFPHEISGMAWDGSQLWVVHGKGLYSSLGSTWKYHAFPEEIEWPGGLEWDGESFWVADSTTMALYRLSPEEFKILGRWAYPGTIPADLAWDGSLLWIIDGIDSTLYALDPSDGRIVKEIKLDPEIFPRPVGLAWDGIALWVADMHSGIRRIHPEDGRVLGTMAAPREGQYPIALAWDHGHGRLLVADHETKRLYQLKVRAWAP
ncbi:MAG: PKD domain-containing protein [Candidatus Bipolaricaulota bacterium]|nr:PKD domain-containing protein [Candidatus Bipolaricaulota bacterium]MDW8031321.1 PKD domain-containing protein [Candidatus Bipolaricaulota bacterium]